MKKRPKLKIITNVQKTLPKFVYSKKKKTNPQKRVLRKVSTEKTTVDIITELRKQYKSYKSLSRSLRVSEKDLLSFRKNLHGISSHISDKGKEKLSRDSIKKAARRKGIDITTEVKTYQGEFVNRNILKVPLKFPKNTTKIHIIGDIVISLSNGVKVPKIVSQVYHISEGTPNGARNLFTEYLQSFTEGSSIIGITIKKYGYRFF